MPFVQIDIEKEIEKRRKESLEFCKVWDENQEAYEREQYKNREKRKYMDWYFKIKKKN